MFNNKFLVTNKTNLNYSAFEVYKNYNISLLNLYTNTNYVSKQLLYMLTKKRQQFFFYTENKQLVSIYMYNFELYNHLFVYGDWYAGYITNYINVRQNLMDARIFSNLLFVNNTCSNYALYQPKAYIFLDQPKDKSALMEFQKFKNLYFENPNLALYPNSYFFLTKSTFYFFFNLYLILFQLKKK